MVFWFRLVLIASCCVVGLVTVLGTVYISTMYIFALFRELLLLFCLCRFASCSYLAPLSLLGTLPCPNVPSILFVTYCAIKIGLMC